MAVMIVLRLVYNRALSDIGCVKDICEKTQIWVSMLGLFLVSDPDSSSVLADKRILSTIEA